MNWLILWLAGASVVWTVGGFTLGAARDRIDSDEVALLVIVGLIWPLLLLVLVLAIPFTVAFRLGRWTAGGYEEEPEESP